MVLLNGKLCHHAPGNTPLLLHTRVKLPTPRLGSLCECCAAVAGCAAILNVWHCPASVHPGTHDTQLQATVFASEGCVVREIRTAPEMKTSDGNLDITVDSGKDINFAR